MSEEKNFLIELSELLTKYEFYIRNKGSGIEITQHFPKEEILWNSDYLIKLQQTLFSVNWKS